MDNKLKNILWLFAEQGGRFVSGILITILIINYLGAEQFGIFSISISINAILTPLVGLGIAPILFKEIAKSKRKAKVYLRCSIALRLIISVFILFTITAINLFLDHRSLSLLNLLAVGLLFDSFLGFKDYFSALLLNRYFTISSIISVIFQVIAALTCVLAKLDLIWFVLPYIILKASQTALLYYFFSKLESKINITLNNKIAKYLLKQSIPMMLAAFAGLLYGVQDQFFINAMLGEKQVGIYVVGIKLVISLMILPTIISNVFFPDLVECHKNKCLFNHKITGLYSFFFILGAFLFFVFFFGSDFIIGLLFSSEFANSAQVMSIYSIIFVIAFLQSLNNKVLLLENLQKIIFYRAIFSLIVNGLLNMIMIPIWGINGAALSTILSEVLIIVSYAATPSTRVLIKYQVNALNIFRIYNFIKEKKK